MDTQQYTWEDLKAAVGRDFSDGGTRLATDSVERGAIRLFCEAMDLDCPLHYDAEAARRWGYAGIVAPFSSINQTFTGTARWQPGQPTRWPDPKKLRSADTSNATVSTRPLPMPPTTQRFLADLEIEFYRPVYVGDRLATRGEKLVNVAVKRTSVGLGAFTTFEREVLNQDGALVARVRSTTYSFNTEG